MIAMAVLDAGRVPAVTDDGLVCGCLVGGDEGSSARPGRADPRVPPGDRPDPATRCGRDRRGDFRWIADHPALPCFPTEADAIADVLLRHGVPKDTISLERLATNTSENFWLSAELLRDLGMAPGAFLAVAKPYADRRIIATARRRWPDKQVAVTSEQVPFKATNSFE